MEAGDDLVYWFAAEATITGHARAWLECDNYGTAYVPDTNLPQW